MVGSGEASTYQSLAVETVVARGNQALYHGEGVAVQGEVAVDAQARCVLQPQAAVDDVAQVGVRGAVLVEVCKGQVEQVACAHQVAAVALDVGMEACRGEGEDVEGMAQAVEVEDVGGPAVRVGQGGQVLAVLDLELGGAREVVGALGFGEPRQAGAGVHEVGEDLVDDLGGERLEGAFWRPPVVRLGYRYRCVEHLGHGSGRAGRQTGRHADMQTGRQADGRTDRQTEARRACRGPGQIPLILGQQAVEQGAVQRARKRHGVVAAQRSSVERAGSRDAELQAGQAGQGRQAGQAWRAAQAWRAWRA